jgi:hypothetical protein
MKRAIKLPSLSVDALIITLRRQLAAMEPCFLRLQFIWFANMKNNSYPISRVEFTYTWLTILFSGGAQ